MVRIPLLEALLIGARIIAMFTTAPIFGSRNYPVRLKVGLAMFLTLLLFPIVGHTVLIDASTLLSFGAYLINEIIIGLTMGLILSIFFNFVYLAGGIIDRELGFSMVSVISPLDESEIPITANLLYLMAVLIFFQLDLHHLMIQGIVASFGQIPVGTPLFSQNVMPIILDVLGASFVLGFKIAAPFMVIILISNIVLGILSKAMPGMNIFILGMPFKIFFGLLIFIVMMPYLYQAFAVALKNSFFFLEELFKLFQGVFYVAI